MGSSLFSNDMCVPHLCRISVWFSIWATVWPTINVQISTARKKQISKCLEARAGMYQTSYNFFENKYHTVLNRLRQGLRAAASAAAEACTSATSLARSDSLEVRSTHPKNLCYFLRQRNDVKNYTVLTVHG